MALLIDSQHPSTHQESNLRGSTAIAGAYASSLLIEEHSEWLHELEMQAAREGIHAPPQVKIEIARIRQTIKELEANLQQLPKQHLSNTEQDELSKHLPAPIPASKQEQISLGSRNRIGSIQIGDVAGHDQIKAREIPPETPKQNWIIPVLVVLAALLVVVGLLALRVL